MKKILMLAALAAVAAGCGVKKINYEKKVDNEGTTTYSYRIYQNDHWLNTKASAFKGGMDADGKFEFQGEGLQSSPSEEFNKTMQTYTSAFVQLAQIAAAAYNPSASTATANKATTVNVQTTSDNKSQLGSDSVKAGSGSATASGQQQAASQASQQSQTSQSDCPGGVCGASSVDCPGGVCEAK